MIVASLLAISVFLETYSAFPFVLLLIVFLSIHFKKSTVLLCAFAGGLLLDALLFRTLGSSSIFLLIFAFLTLAYQNKFEADTLAFVTLFSFVGAFLYTLYTNQENAIPISFVSVLSSAIIYTIYKGRLKRKKKW